MFGQQDKRFSPTGGPGGLPWLACGTVTLPTGTPGPLFIAAIHNNKGVAMEHPEASERPVTGSANPAQWSGRQRFLAAAVLILALVAAGLVLYSRSDHALLGKFRRAAAAPSGVPADVWEELSSRPTGPNLAMRLADDPDPRVRVALIDSLLRETTAIVLPSTDAQVQAGVVIQGGNGYRISFTDQFHPVVRKVLADPDRKVCNHAALAVAKTFAARYFPKELLDALSDLETADRVEACRFLAGWSPQTALEVAAEEKQPEEVRLAALKSYNLFGARLDDSGLGKRLAELAKASRGKVREAALTALRLHPDQAAEVWLRVLLSGTREDRVTVARVWAQALASGGEPSPHLNQTERLLNQRSEPLDVKRVAALTHVLCESSRLRVRQLEQTPRANERAALREKQAGQPGPTHEAFSRELGRLHHILRALYAASWYSNLDEFDASFSLWLPGDELDPDRPPPRQLRSFVQRQTRDLFAWCEKHREDYRSRFLHPAGESPWFLATRKRPAAEAYSLGEVLDELALPGRLEKGFWKK
jgi:hypothetical protein